MSGDVTDVLCAVVPPRCIGLLFHEEAQYLSPLYPRCQHMVVRGTLQPGEERQMTFEDVLDQAMSMLQRRGRLTYRTLQRQFQLDDAALEDLKEELLQTVRRGNQWSTAAMLH